MEISWLDGLIGGAVGGIAQGMVAMIATAIMGQGLFWPLVLIGHMFLPYTDNPDQTGGTIFKGLVIHMIVTMMLGVLFALVAPALANIMSLFIWGLLYGALIFVIDLLGLLKAIDPTMRAKMNMGLFFFTHLVFGGVLGWWLRTLPINL